MIQKTLTTIEYRQLQDDKCMFINEAKRVIILLYMDDCLLFAHDNNVIDEEISKIQKAHNWLCSLPLGGSGGVYLQIVTD